MVSKKQLRRLRLREGDIVLVRSPEDMKQLAMATMVTHPDGRRGPQCPIVIAEGSVHRLSKEYLRKLLEK